MKKCIIISVVVAHKLRKQNQNYLIISDDFDNKSDKMQSNFKDPKTKPKLKKHRVNRSLQQSFSNESLQISGNRIRAFDTFQTFDHIKSSDAESQQEFLDTLSDAMFSFNRINSVIATPSNNKIHKKSINFPSMDFPTPSGKCSDFETPLADNSLVTFPTLDDLNSTTNSVVQGTPRSRLTKKRSLKSSRKPKSAHATLDISTTATKRPRKGEYRKANLDLTTMNLDALSTLRTNTCLTEKSTNVGITSPAKRIKYCPAGTDKMKAKLVKVQAKTKESKKLVKCQKSENQQVQVQEKYKDPEFPGRLQVRVSKIESISSIHRNSPQTAQPARAEQTREAISRISKENKIVKRIKDMLTAKDEELKNTHKIIDKQKSNHEKLKSLVKSKDAKIKLQKENILDFGEKVKEKDEIIQKSETMSTKLIKEVGELNKAINKLGVTSDSGYSRSKSRRSGNYAQNQTTVETTVVFSILNIKHRL